MRDPKPLDVDRTIEEVMQAEYEWFNSLDIEYVQLRQPRPGPQYFEDWDID